MLKKANVNIDCLNSLKKFYLPQSNFCQIPVELGDLLTFKTESILFAENIIFGY